MCVGAGLSRGLKGVLMEIQSSLVLFPLAVPVFLSVSQEADGDYCA